jgi:hypothetical protein
MLKASENKINDLDDTDKTVNTEQQNSLSK